MVEMIYADFTVKAWMTMVARWKAILARTGFDLLNGAALGEDKRLVIDIAAMRQALEEDGALDWSDGRPVKRSLQMILPS